MTNEALEPPPFYSDSFFHLCYDLVLDHFGLDINRDVNVSNALQVYTYLSINI